jgi:cysteine-rich repeat protein
MGRARFAFVAIPAAVACNAVLDVGEPVVVGEGSEGRPAPDEDPPAGAVAACGNGTLEPGEQCDDGNERPGDGCDACVVECSAMGELADPSTGSCYLLAGRARQETWSRAADACAAWGGTLAALASTDELALVQSRIDTDTWIGASSVAGAFAWVTGEPFRFAPWASGEPSAEGCVLLAGDLTGFAVRPCSDALSWLCERPPAGTSRTHP